MWRGTQVIINYRLMKKRRFNEFHQIVPNITFNFPLICMGVPITESHHRPTIDLYMCLYIKVCNNSLSLNNVYVILQLTWLFTAKDLLGFFAICIVLERGVSRKFFSECFFSLDGVQTGSGYHVLVIPYSHHVVFSKF